MVSYRPDNPGSDGFLAVALYCSAWKSLLNGAATMDTLVALGTGVAWLYSMSVNLWPQWFPMEARHLYYEASAYDHRSD